MNPPKRPEDSAIPPRRHWVRWFRNVAIGLILVVVVVASAVFSITRVPKDGMFRGKLESERIADLDYNSDEAAVERWRNFGPEGLEVLVRGLERADLPLGRTYRRFRGRSDRFLLRMHVPIEWLGHLPQPKMDHTRSGRLAILGLMGALHSDAWSAWPTVSNSLRDEGFECRRRAIWFFAYQGYEHEGALLETLGRKSKHRLLPYFLEAAGNTNKYSAGWHGCAALEFYPETRNTVEPVLMTALRDASATTQMRVAKSLFNVAPDVTENKDVAAILLGLLNDPDDQIAWRVPDLLGKMTVEQERIVGELIKHLKNESSLVATPAARALGTFPDYAEKILPPLWEAHNDPKHHARTWGNGPALKKLNPGGAA